LGIDPKRIAIAGHSMGGWIAAMTASHDHGLLGTILISAADFGRLGQMPRDKLVAEAADERESLAGVTAESMADELQANAKTFGLDNAIAGLVPMPLLVLTADDGLAPDGDALVHGIQTKGGKNVTTMHVATDHSWSDHRIALESIVITWLAGLK
jgi:pimeloyl-ACP methyl ester carboxylesterase